MVERVLGKNEVMGPIPIPGSPNLNMNLKWTSDKLAKLKLKYVSGMSMREVGNKLGVSVSTIYHAMKRHGIVRRKPSDTNSINFLKSPLSFSIKTKLNTNERLLKVAGLMLYWAEGSKRGKFVVDFANCDEKMISLFLKFLRIIYDVREKKLRIFLYCYSDQDSAQLINYWSDLTKIPRPQFTKPYVKKAPDSRVHGKMEHGLVHIRYADMRLHSKIMQDIGELANFLNLPGW